MAYTISTHNGSQVSRDHNLRNPKIVSKEKHINPNGIHETWLDENPRAMYKKLFGKAVLDYNSKVRRDRQILDYYNQVKNSAKQHPVYEMIVQVGSFDNRPDPEIAKQVLREFTDSWELRNPNLKLTGVYYHEDEEGVQHVHVDYIPFASGCYKKGLAAQAGLVKALEQQGFQKKGHETQQIAWQRRENKALETICVEKGLNIYHPEQKAKEHVNTSLYKATEETKRQQLKAEQYAKSCKEAEERLNGLLEKAERVEANIHTYERLKAEYGALKEFVGGMKLGDKNLLDVFKERQKTKNRQKSTFDLDER